MTTKLDIWTPRQIEMCTEYAKGNDVRVLDMLSNNIDAMGFLETTMKDKLGNALLRERITARNEGLIHSCAMHHYDAHDACLNRPAEVKSEQHCTLNGRNYQVTGGGAFGIQGYDSVMRLIDDNPIMHMNAFIDGRLAYNVSFNFNDSDISVRLEDTITRRKEKNAKTQPKFLWSDWIRSRSLVVTYLNETYFKLLSRYTSTDLMWAIKLKWKNQQKELRKSLITDLSSQTQSSTSLPILDSPQPTKTDPIERTPTPYIG